MVSSNEKGAPLGNVSSPPPLPARPASPSGPRPLAAGFGFATASSTSLDGSAAGSSAFTTGINANAESLRLAAQHERLILELLPFKDSTQFREWLAFLEGDWDEYCRDCLDPTYVAALFDGAGTPRAIPDQTPDDPEPDKATTTQRAKDAINSQSALFLAYHPNKTAWTPEDHAVRFVATAIADSLLRRVWTEREWRKRPLEIAKAVYEVLSYKRAGYVSFRQQQWSSRLQERQKQQQQQQQQQQEQDPSSRQREAAGLEQQRQQHQPMPARHLHPEIMDNPPDYEA